MLVFVPIAFIVGFAHLGGIWEFLTSALAIIPMAKLLGTATEELAARVGSGLGGLLNATFGNATELIIAFFALQAGLTEVVKASLTGSIIGNLLFVLG
ncbi:MAG: cation transporter, partial [Candidatus Chloroheliales bacterium]